MRTQLFLACLVVSSCSESSSGPSDVADGEGAADVADGVEAAEGSDGDAGADDGDAPDEPSCEDGIQNQGETGIDCGGPCDECDPPADYYVSADGDDDADGRTPGTAWRTLERASAGIALLAPGERIAFRRGDTFRGVLVVAGSGSDGAPIEIGAFGGGPKPVVTGLAVPTGWTAVGGGVYSAPLACESAPEVVVVDGVQRGMGRWPNEGEWAHYESHAGRDSLTDAELPASPDWTGAEVVLRACEWAITRSPITGHSGTTLTFENTADDWPEYDLKDGWGYFVQNAPATLDAFGEFFFDPGTGTLYVHFGADAPDAHEVQASTLDTLVSFSPGASHVLLEDLAVTGANRRGIAVLSNEAVTVRDCAIEFTGHFGISLEGCGGCAVVDTVIAHSNDKGIFAAWGTPDLQVSGCTIAVTGLFAGLGLTSTQAHIGIYSSGGDRTVLENNRIVDSGYSAINHGNTDGVVRHNVIDGYCSIMSDGGGIYYGSQTRAGNITVTGNVVLNARGALGGLPEGREPSAANGIYVDYNTLNGVEVTDNVVGHCFGGGIFIHESHNIRITGNTVYDCTEAVRFQDSGLGVLIRDITMTDNAFVARTSDQATLWARTSDASNDFALWGRFDGNVYARPLDDERSLQASAGTWPGDFLSLEEWRALSSQDAGSRTSPVVVAPYSIEEFLGDSLFANGTFASDVTGVACWNDAGNCATSWDAAGLDGGALRVSFDDRAPTTGSLLTLSVGAIEAGRDYVLQLSVEADAAFSSGVQLYLRQRGDPWTRLSAVAERSVGAGRSELEALLPADAADGDAVIVVEIDAADSRNRTLRLDNVRLREARVERADPDDHIRFEVNDSPVPASVGLDGEYTDVFGAVHAGSVTVPPFGGVVLLR